MCELPEGSYKVPIESVSVRINDSGRMEIVFATNLVKIDQKKSRRVAYLKQYYRDHPEKFLKKKKIIIRERMQDKIDRTFRDEDARLAKIKFAFCQNAACPKPNKKYVAGSGIKLDFDGLPLYFCSGRCKEAFLAQSNKII